MNYHLRVGCVKFLGYVNYCEDVDNLSLDSINKDDLGFDFEIVLFMLQYFTNLMKTDKLQISMKQYQVFGSPVNITVPEGPWDGLVAALKHNAIDIAIPVFYITSLRLMAVDFLLPVGNYDERLMLLVHPLEISTFLPAFSKVFALDIWAAGTLSWMVVSLCLATITYIELHAFHGQSKIGYRHSKMKPMYLNFIDGLYDTLFMKRDAQKWSGLHRKILITVWSVTALMGLKLFAATYVKSLTPEMNRKLPFTSFAELAKLMQEKKYTLIITNKDAAFNAMRPKSKIKAFEVLRNVATPENVLFVDGIAHGMDRTAQMPGSALLTSSGIKGMARKMYPHLLEVPVIETSQVLITSYAIPKHSKHVTKFRDAYFTAVEMGITSKIYKKYRIFQQEHNLEMTIEKKR